MSGTVDVRYADPRHFSARDVAALRPMLSPTEEQRCQRFLRPHLSHDFIVAHALVRTTLGHALGRSPRALRFTFNEHGRPHIDGLHFNLSHTDGCIALALSFDMNVGIDVEAIKPRPFHELAAHHFAPTEIAALAQADDPMAHFYAVWTLKESYIKARGMGLAIPLDGFGFSLSPVALTIDPSKVRDTAARWSFKRRAPLANVAGALAFESRSVPQFTERWVAPNEVCGD